MDHRPTGGTEPSSRAEQPQTSAQGENSHLCGSEQLLLPLEPIPARVETVKEDSKFSRIAIPKPYAAQMAALARYLRTKEIPLARKPFNKRALNELHSITWVIGWHPHGFLGVMRQSHRNHFISDVQQALLEKKGARTKLVSYVDRLCVRVEIDSKARLRVPLSLVRKAQIQNRVVFTSGSYMIEVWPEESFNKVFKIEGFPSYPKDAQR